MNDKGNQMERSDDSLSLRLYKFLYQAYRKLPFIYYSVRWVRKNYRVLQRVAFLRRPVVDAGPILEEIIRTGKPFAAGKMGSDEVRALPVFKRREAAKAKGRKPPKYKDYILHSVFMNCGVFPRGEESFDVWARQYLDAVRQCDLLAAWDVAGEAEVLKCDCPNATLVRLVSLEPYFSKAPWTFALSGKRVLVISPFVDTIRNQYARRENLWRDQRILPEFELLTIKAPLSAGLSTPQAPNWSVALEEMRRQMDAMDYDVVLIGAGAFSLPLAVHARVRGKIGIHLGGALQLVFGIAGLRWENNKKFKPFFNKYWVRPSRQETPQDVTRKLMGVSDYW